MFGSELVLIREIPTWTLVPVVAVIAAGLTWVVRWITGAGTARK